jgi:Rps23 Pro-64 3,4-dihydroxylase Tpa1-like proline 4-hydroxylase
MYTDALAHLRRLRERRFKNRNDMTFALNPIHQADQLALDYARKGRMQVRDFFTDETAETIHQRLYQAPWHLAYNEGLQVHEHTPDQLKNITREQAADIQNKVYQGAQQGYQFLYNHFPISNAYFAQGGKSSFGAQGEQLFRIFEYLNSPAMLGFFRTLTGHQNTRWVDAHATLYRAGHFLKFHTDENAKEQRLAAYVLNFSKDWGRDWGGLLQFWDKNYDVELAYRPIFNALNIFSIPADHSVSVVAPYCPGLRFSITGWLREGEPNGAIAGWQPA